MLEILKMKNYTLKEVKFIIYKLYLNFLNYVKRKNPKIDKYISTTGRKRGRKSWSWEQEEQRGCHVSGGHRKGPETGCEGVGLGKGHLPHPQALGRGPGGFGL